MRRNRCRRSLPLSQRFDDVLFFVRRHFDDCAGGVGHHSVGYHVGYPVGLLAYLVPRVLDVTDLGQVAADDEPYYQLRPDRGGYHVNVTPAHQPLVQFPGQTVVTLVENKNKKKRLVRLLENRKFENYGTR